MLMSLFNQLKACLTDESGQGMVEYALIIALIAIVVIGVISALGGSITNVFQSIVDALPGVGA